jgi:PAS domain-containing protein
MDHLQAIIRRFSDALNKGLMNTLGEIPTAARLADQFNLRAYGTKTISRETARKWKCGLALPEAGNLQVLIEWLNLSPASVFSSGPLDLNSHLKLLYSAAELRSASHKLRESEHLAQAALNALSPRTAVLDKTGVIILVNNAWRSHAVADPNENFYKSCCEGINYL